MADDERYNGPTRAAPIDGCRIRKLAVLALLAVMTGLLLLGPAGSADSATTSSSSQDRVVVPMLFPFLTHRDWEDDFGAPRADRMHEGNDILAPKGTPLVAVVSGVLDWMNFTGKTSTYNSYPYYNILLRGDDGNYYFYIHLNNDSPDGNGGYTDDGQGGPEHAYAQGLQNDSRVTAGQIIGYVGDSGDAETSVPHLHFEIHLGGYKNPINPYWSLKAAPTYDEWLAAGGGPIVTPTTSTSAPTTSTTAGTTTTEPSRPPGGQLDPGLPHFSDVRTTDWFYSDLELLYRAGVVKGSANGLFVPYASITRAQFAAMLARTFLPSQLTGAAAPAPQAFQDVAPNYWAYAEIQAAAAAGLVHGVGQGRFAPESPITRAQTAVMISRVLDVLGADYSAAPAVAQEVGFPDVGSLYWAHAEITRVCHLGVMGGCTDGLFRAESQAARAQAVAVLARTLRLSRSASGFAADAGR